jgi:hypothetical protein
MQQRLDVGVGKAQRRWALPVNLARKLQVLKQRSAT